MSEQYVPEPGIFDFRGKIFYGPNGVVINYEDLPASTLMTALTRQGKHVFSNEAVSKVSAEKARRRSNGLEPMNDDEEAELLENSLAHYRELWTTPDAWLPERSEGQGAHESREQYFTRVIGEKHTSDFLKGQGFKKAETKKGEEVHFIDKKKKVAYPLSKWVVAYLADKKYGTERKDAIDTAVIAAIQEENDKKAAKRAALEAAASMPTLDIDVDEDEAA